MQLLGNGRRLARYQSAAVAWDSNDARIFQNASCLSPHVRGAANNTDLHKDGNHRAGGSQAILQKSEIILQLPLWRLLWRVRLRLSLQVRPGAELDCAAFEPLQFLPKGFL